MLFNSLQKLLSFLRKSNFRILDIQILWRHQTPKRNTRNAFYWITWEVNMSVNDGQLMSYYKIKKKKKKKKKKLTTTATWKLVPDSFVFAKN